MTFLKEDLVGKHYSWTTTINAAAFTGEPSRRLFNPFNGNQVLFVINAYASSLPEKFTLSDAHKVEDMILNNLPEGVKSEMSVFNWLKEACSTQAISA